MCGTQELLPCPYRGITLKNELDWCSRGLLAIAVCFEHLEFVNYERKY